MVSESKPVALVVLIHPKTVEKKEKILSLLPSIAPLFRRPSTQCTARSVFTPATRKGGMLGMVPPEEKSSMLGVVEIWTSPAALSALQSKPEYKDYFGTVRREGLYDPSQDVTAWYPTAGFVARKTEKETPKAGIVMLAKFVCKDGEGVREKLVDVLGHFCDWVEANEEGTLTYCVMINPKALNEVLLFERYKDLAALGAHGKTPQFKAMFQGTGPFLQGRKTVLSEWEELDGSFVSNTPGGTGEDGLAKFRAGKEDSEGFVYTTED